TYSYDDLNQLVSFLRADGQSQSWALDAPGNFSSVTTNGVPQNRTHNAQNEVTTVGSAALQFDNNGNLTRDEQGRELKYDAWNRLVQVWQGAQLLVTHSYDGLGRRVTETPAGQPTRQLYYSAAWQVVEERENGQVVAQNVWSPVYVDALIERDQ